MDKKYVDDIVKWIQLGFIKKDSARYKLRLYGRDKSKEDRDYIEEKIKESYNTAFCEIIGKRSNCRIRN